jgi:hypothetical protein
MKWQFFLGACFLTAAMLLPHARTRPVFAGMALAAVLRAIGRAIGRDRWKE